jgi:uncharacterized repeat protein (TIGR01451 family)
VLGWLGLSLMPSAGALVDVSVSDSPDPVIVGNQLTYTINVTNVSGVTLTNLVVTNRLSGAFTYDSANTNNGPVVLTNGTLRFLVNRLANSSNVALTFNGRPALLGQLTNSVSITTTNSFLPETNLVATSTVVAGFSDLVIGITAPTGSFLQNDQLTYRLDVTNQGPNTATNVILTGRFPAGASVSSITPSNGTFTASSSNLSLTLGSLASGAASSLLLTLAPSAAGNFSFAAQINAATFHDSNSTNSSDEVDLTIQAPIAASLGVSFLVLTQQFIPQSGLMIQRVRLSNAGASAIPAARVLVSGLTNRSATGIPDRLVNAVGTNQGSPFVLYGAPLAAGSSVDLTLEYFFPSRTPYTNLVLSAIAVASSTNTVPSTSQPISLRITNVVDAVWIEFPAVLGRRYSVLYSDTLNATNWNVAMPSIVAPGNRVQWLDEGPPKTLSNPLSGGSNRFYRVIESP